MTARPNLTLRELVTKWKWLILPLGGILFALTVIFPQIGAFEWIALIPALLGLMLCFICAELERKSISRET